MSERRYPVQNTVTKERLSVPLREYKQYMEAVNPSTFSYLFKPLSDVPGVIVGPESIEQTLVPMDRVRDAIGDGSLRLLRGDDDPMWEAARKSSVARARRRVAEGRSGAIVATEGLLSGVTFGQSSRLANALAGRDAAELRALGIDAHGGAHFGGQALSLLVLGMLPIPGLGTVVGASKGLRAGSIFEVGAKAAEKARKAIPGEGFGSEFLKSFTAPVAFGVVADVPLAAAMVAADVVDRNKEWTAESISADFLTQYSFALGFAALTSIPLAALGSAVRAGGKKALQRSEDLLERERVGSLAEGMDRQQFFDSVFRGGWRYLARKHFRGKGFGIGDMFETGGYKTASKLSKQAAGRSASESYIGRWLAPNVSDDFINLHLINQKAIQDLGAASTGRQIVNAIRPLKNSISDPALLADLARLEQNAALVATARKEAARLVLDSRAFAKEYLKQTYKHPVGIASVGTVNAANLIDDGLRLLNLKPLGKGAGDWSVRAAKTLNVRKDFRINTFKKTGQYPSTKLLDDKLEEAFPGIGKRLRQMDNAEARSLDVLQMTDDFGSKAAGLFDASDLIGVAGASGARDLRSTLRSIDGSLRGLTDDSARIVDSVPFTRGEKAFYAGAEKGLGNSLIDTRLDDLRKGLDLLTDANRVVADLMDNARPLIRAPKAMSQEEILAAQVETVMSTKQRIGETLRYVALYGGGARQTVSFGGVMAFRTLSSASEKRQAFRGYHDLISRYSSNPDLLVSHTGDLVGGAASFDMDLGAALAANNVASYTYLGTQLPRSDDSAILPEDFSAAEMENFLEAVGAITDPMSVLATAADGSTSDQSVDALRAVYPELYTEMVLDVAEFVAEFGDKLSHAKLLGLDAFTGGALGYSDGPAPNLTYRQPAYQTAGQAQAAGATGGPENQRLTIQQNSTPAGKVGAM